MSAQTLITEHLDLWTGAVTKKSSSGRGSNGKVELTGVKKLRELILELAVRGKLVHQNPNEEPAILLAEKIAAERAKLMQAGAIKKSPKLPQIAPEEIPFDIPSGWHWVRLGELVKKIGSGATPRGGKNAYVQSGIPFLRSQNIWNDGLNLQDVAYIPPETHERMANTHVFPNDILLNITGASLGRCTVVPTELEMANVSQHVTIIRTIDPLNRLYLHYLILSPYVQSLVWGRQVGMAREGLSKKVLEQFEIPLPPLEEQHRIVQKVDELMALCDRLEQHTSDQLDAHETLVDTLLGTLTQSDNATELADNWARLAEHFDTLFTTEQSIDKLKQTILLLAVMGRLVEQDAEDEPASILLGKIAEDKVKVGSVVKAKAKKTPTDDCRSLSQLPRGWVWVRIQSLLLGDTQNGLSKKADKNPEGVPLLRISAATTNQNYIVDENDFNLTSTVTEEQLLKYKLEPQDLLAVRFNGNRSFVGRTALFQGDKNNLVVYPDKLIRLRFPVDFVVPRLVSLFMNSRTMREEIEKYCATTVGNWGISAKNLKQVFIPLPPLAEQHRIVQKVDELMALCDHLKQRLNQASNTRCQLARSVVEGALEG